MAAHWGGEKEMRGEEAKAAGVERVTGRTGGERVRPDVT
jgi:hypothetical protein